MRVLIKAPFSTFSGYGNDGIGMTLAFLRRGDDVYIQPTAIDAPLPQEIAQLLTKPLEAPFDLFINHVGPTQIECTPETARNSGMTVGWSMWEYTNLDYLPLEDRETLRKRMENFDAFAGYSDIDTPTFQPYYDGPIITQQGGYNPEQWEFMERDENSKEFYFCMLGVLSERKDPWKAIEAFTMAGQEDPEFARWARLSLKTTSPGLHSKIEDLYRATDPETGEEYTRIRIFYEMWPTEVVKEFYRVQNVLLAPSRGEGKNMPALEFMSTGGTVIATNWAGHTQWLNSEYSYPLNYTLEPVDTDTPGTLNARADVQHLKELLLHTFHNREEVREKGRIASTVIPFMASWDAVIQNLLLKLRTAVPEKGERLWTIAQIGR